MKKTGMTPKKAATIWKPTTKLKAMRIKRGLSQKELSIKSGVPFRSLQTYEQRKKNIEGAKLDTLCDLALSLDCNIEDIIERKDLIKKLKATT